MFLKKDIKLSLPFLQKLQQKHTFYDLQTLLSNHFINTDMKINVYPLTLQKQPKLLVIDIHPSLQELVIRQSRKKKHIFASHG